MENFALLLLIKILLIKNLKNSSVDLNIYIAGIGCTIDFRAHVRLLGFPGSVQSQLVRVQIDPSPPYRQGKRV